MISLNQIINRRTFAWHHLLIKPHLLTTLLTPYHRAFFQKELFASLIQLKCLLKRRKKNGQIRISVTCHLKNCSLHRPCRHYQKLIQERITFLTIATTRTYFISTSHLHLYQNAALVIIKDKSWMTQNQIPPTARREESQGGSFPLVQLQPWKRGFCLQNTLRTRTPLLKTKSC